MSAIDRFRAGEGRTGVAFVAGFTVVSWAGIFPLTRFGLRWFAPFDLVALRLIATALALASVLVFMRPRIPRARELAALAVCAFFGIALYNLLLSWGLVTLSAGAASFLTNTIPIFTALLSFVINGERLSGLSLAGMLIAFAGIAILASGQPGGFSFGSGAMLVLGATICSALYIVLQRRLVHSFSPLETATWLMLLSAAFLLPFSMPAIEAAFAAPPAGLLVVLLLAIVPGALGQIAWLRVLKAVPAGRAASLLFLIPPLATVFGVLLLGETVSIQLVAGGAFAIAGVALVHGGRAPPAPDALS